MSATGERGTQAPSFDLSPPAADSLVAQLPRDAPVLLDPDEDGSDPVEIGAGADLGESLGSGERFVPTLEDLAQDWLAEPEPPAVHPEDDGEGSGVLEAARLVERIERASKAGPDPLDEVAPPWAAVDSTAEFSASAVARMEGNLSASASHDAWDSVPPAAAVISAQSPAQAGSRARWWGLAIAAALVSAAATVWIFGFGNSGRGGAADSADTAQQARPGETTPRQVAAPPVTGREDGRGSAAEAAAAAGIVSPPAVDDGLLVQRFEVGRPGPGKTCEGSDGTFSRDRDRKIAACYEVADPHHADRVIVLWDKDGHTVRRGVRDSPRAARLVSTAYLSLHDQPTGTWTVRLVRDDKGSLTELARRRIVIEP